jgi:protein-disulfide isomerase
MSTPQDDLTLETGTELELSQLLLPIQEDDHVQGPAEARLTLVEYGDYECPACGILFATIRELHEKLTNDIRIVYRHYPLSGSHPLAQPAAEAAEAAGAQGKFWEMHHLLFENQRALSTKEFERFGEELTLDMDQFRTGLKDRTFEARVREDFKRGVANGVYGTPGLFVNGVRHSSDLDSQHILVQLNVS